MNRVRRFNFQTIKYHLYYYSVDWQKLEVSLIYNLPRRQYWVWLRLLIILIEGTTENHSNPTRIPVLSFRLKYSSTFFLLACWSFTVEQLISVALWKSKNDCLVLEKQIEREFQFSFIVWNDFSKRGVSNLKVAALEKRTAASFPFVPPY